MGQDKWYLFNDAEVKPFDPTQIAMECFGGEMTVRLLSLTHTWVSIIAHKHVGLLSLMTTWVSYYRSQTRRSVLSLKTTWVCAIAQKHVDLYCVQYSGPFLLLTTGHASETKNVQIT